MKETTYDENGNPQQPLTYGQESVGIDFNPAGDPNVLKVKDLCAQIIDLCDQLRGTEKSEKARLFSVAITEVQTAQMWAVKAITYKY